jgi:hypothetical protein
MRTICIFVGFLCIAKELCAQNFDDYGNYLTAENGYFFVNLHWKK